MTTTTDFIAELFYAANQVDRLSTSEKRRLLERGPKTTRALRELLSEAGRFVQADAATEHAVAFVAESVDRFSNETVATNLLRLGNEIRLLRIQNNARLDGRNQ